MKFTPMFDRVLVKRVGEEKDKESRILIPESAERKSDNGLVLAIGNGKFDDDGNRIPMEVAVGQKVLFGKYSGTEIKIEGDDCLILREDEVLGIIE